MDGLISQEAQSPSERALEIRGSGLIVDDSPLSSGLTLQEVAAEPLERGGLEGLDERERTEPPRSTWPSESFASELTGAIPAITWTADASGAFDFVSPQWSTETGLDRREALGSGWLEAVHPDDDTLGLTAAFAQPDKDGHYEREFRLRRADGSYRWQLARAHAVRDDTGNVVRWVGLTVDIEDRKRAEETWRLLEEAGNALGFSLDYHETLRRLAGVGVPQFADYCAVDILDVDGGDEVKRIATAHTDAGRVARIEELLGRFPTLSSQDFGVARVIRTGRPELFKISQSPIASGMGEGPFEIHRSMGLRSCIIVPLKVRGKVIGALSYGSSESRRIYDRRDLEFAEELARRASFSVENALLFESSERERMSAEIANRTKDEFIATVSHELRTPLNSILGWTHMLRSGLTGEQRERALEVVERNANAQAQLIEDLLDISRITTGKLRLTFSAVDPARAVELALDSLRPIAERKGIGLSADLEGGITVSADADRLQQVAWNLVSNAVKFTEPGGQVDVFLCGEAYGGVRIEVRDNGRGIDPRFLPHIFERFRQADGGTTRAHGGLGLGLAIVKNLIELHGGHIEAKSNGKGSGAAFTVTLPASRPDDATVDSGRTSSLAPAYHPSWPALNGLSVLIVDDDPDTRELLVSAFRGCGSEVRTAPDVRGALRSFGDSVPDILVSDIGMPGEDGYALIRSIRSLPQAEGGAVPAVAMTAYTRAEDRSRALASGFSMHVAKPIELNELFSSVASLCANAQAGARTQHPRHRTAHRTGGGR